MPQTIDRTTPRVPPNTAGTAAACAGTSQGSVPRDHSLQAFVECLSRRSRLAVTLLLGAATATALAPIYALPAIFIGFGGLLLMIRASRTLLVAAITGWFFGLGYFVSGLYWVGNSFLVDADRYGSLAVPAVLGLSAILALFASLAAVASRLLSRCGLGDVVSLAVAWTVAEWLRGNILTGFPWNLIGYVWTITDQTLQGAALLGVYGLSFVTVLIAAAPALSFTSDAARHGLRRWSPVLLAVLLPLLLWNAGELRIRLASPAGASDVRLRIVQGNVAQSVKWVPEERDRIVQRYLTISLLDRPADIDLVIWPETAVPLALANRQDGRAAVAAAIPEGGWLVTGSVRFEVDSNGIPTPRNSLLTLSDSAAVLATYDKARLVPFGEYIPLRPLLPFEKLTAGRSDFLPGSGPTTVDIGGLPSFQPLICYEAIFPGWAVKNDATRPQWLLNVTNDAWFGTSTGPYQHLQMARTRAVERGLPLVRAASTGVSAVVDALGRVTARLGLNETGFLDAALPRPLSAGTPYDRFGEAIFLTIMVLAMVASFVWRRIRPGTTQTSKE